MRCNVHILTVGVFGLLLLVGTSGCSFAYPFEISGLVQSADGTPLPDVAVFFEAEGIWESSFPVVTQPDGTFKARVRINDIEFMHEEMPKWTLQLTKNGFENTTVDVSPKSKPKSPRQTTYIDTKPTM